MFLVTEVRDQPHLLYNATPITFQEIAGHL